MDSNEHLSKEKAPSSQFNSGLKRKIPKKFLRDIFSTKEDVDAHFEALDKKAAERAEKRKARQTEKEENAKKDSTLLAKEIDKLKSSMNNLEQENLKMQDRLHKTAEALKKCRVQKKEDNKIIDSLLDRIDKLQNLSPHMHFIANHPMHCFYPTRFGIGDIVRINFGEEKYLKDLYVSAVLFTTDGIYYTVSFKIEDEVRQLDLIHASLIEPNAGWSDEEMQLMLLNLEQFDESIDAQLNETIDLSSNRPDNLKTMLSNLENDKIEKTEELENVENKLLFSEERQYIINRLNNIFNAPDAVKDLKNDADKSNEDINNIDDGTNK